MAEDNTSKYKSLPKKVPEFKVVDVTELNSSITGLAHPIPVYASYDVDGCYYNTVPPADG